MTFCFSISSHAQERTKEYIEKICTQAAKLGNDSLAYQFLSDSLPAHNKAHNAKRAKTIKDVVSIYKEIAAKNDKLEENFGEDAYKQKGYIGVTCLEDDCLMTDYQNYMIMSVSNFAKGDWWHIVEISYKHDNKIKCFDILMESGFLYKELQTDVGTMKIKMGFTSIVVTLAGKKIFDLQNLQEDW